MARYWTKSALIAAATAMGLSAPASAETKDHVEYRIKKGDTLIDLARKYFISPASIPSVMALNSIRNPRTLQIGSILRVPRKVLSYKREDLRVRASSGDVTIIADGKTTRPQKDDLVRQGSIIRTSAKGFISLAGTGNSRVSVPSNSEVRLISAKRYIINNAIDFDVRVQNGRSSIKAPKLKDGERYNVSTPRAVTAVRGTEFRIGFEQASELSLTEVTEGNVLVASGGSEVTALEGLGVSATPAGLNDPERLLGAPSLVDGSKTQTGKIVELRISPLAGATGYRTQIARDATFTEIIAETVSQGTEVTFENIPDGRLSVRSRGIAESGLEGSDRNEGFRRKRIGAEAGLSDSPFDDAFKFVWETEGEGNSFGAFQMWNVKSPDRLVVDEVGLEADGVYVSNLEPGTYKWRIATFQIDEGEIFKIWTEPQELKITE